MVDLRRMSAYASEEFLHQLLKKAVAAGASDIHLKVGQPPGVRVSGDIVYYKTERLLPEDTEAASRIVVGESLGSTSVESLLEHECSYALPAAGRFRVNLFRQRGCLSLVLRSIPAQIPSLEALGLPSALCDLAHRQRGLVLVVGASGNGKSTTLAAMVDEVNARSSAHIVTIEDPIEFLHADKRSCVSQRAVGSDTASFATALRATLRHDPDVILVGEIRDAETLDIAVQAAETGHLVLSTLHSGGAAMAIDRIVDAFPPYQQGQVRLQLASVLRAIVTQLLLPSTRPGRLVPAIEKTIVNHAVAHAIREGRGHHIASQIQTGREEGMVSLELSLADLFRRGEISRETAHSAARNSELLRELLRS